MRLAILLLILLEISCNHSKSKSGFLRPSQLNLIEPQIEQKRDTARTFWGTASTAPHFSVGISVPQNSGLMVTYKTYDIRRDTLYIGYTGLMFDTIQQNAILKKVPINEATMRRLKKAVSNVDTIGYQLLPCGMPTYFGWPRFFIAFVDEDRHADGYVGCVYRKNIYDIVDVFNEIDSVKVIDYDKKELIEREKKCN